MKVEKKGTSISDDSPSVTTIITKHLKISREKKQLQQVNANFTVDIFMMILKHLRTGK